MVFRGLKEIRELWLDIIRDLGSEKFILVLVNFILDGSY